MKRSIQLRATIEPFKRDGSFVVATWAKARKIPGVEPPRHALLDLCAADDAHRNTMKPVDRGQIDGLLRTLRIMARELSITPPEGGFRPDQPVPLTGFSDESIPALFIPSSIIAQPNAALLVDFGPNGTGITPILNLPPSGEYGRVNPETGFPEISIARIPEAEKRWVFYKPNNVAPVARGDGFYGSRRNVILGDGPSNGLGVASVRRDIVMLNAEGIWQEDLARGVSLEAIRTIARNETPGSDALNAVLGALNSEERAALVTQARAMALAA